MQLGKVNFVAHHAYDCELPQLVVSFDSEERRFQELMFYLIRLEQQYYILIVDTHHHHASYAEQTS